MLCAQKSNKSLSRQGSGSLLGFLWPSFPLLLRVAMLSLFLHRVSVVYVYLSIAAAAHGSRGPDPHHNHSCTVHIKVGCEQGTNMTML